MIGIGTTRKPIGLSLPWPSAIKDLDHVAQPRSGGEAAEAGAFRDGVT